MYFSRKKATIILSAVILFIAGRFYKEINSFFFTESSFIGLLLCVVGLMAYFIMWQKQEILLKQISVSDAYQSCEEYRRDIQILKNDKAVLVREKNQMADSLRKIAEKKTK